MLRIEDLKAARTLAGLDQSEAADLMGVHRGTYNGWERGWRPLPEVKFFKFLKVTGVTQQALTEYWASIPKELVYDEDGYPAPFSAKGEREAEDPEAYGDAITALEGSEAPARERKRYEILNRRIAFTGACVKGKEEEFVANALAQWDKDNAAWVDSFLV